MAQKKTKDKEEESRRALEDLQDAVDQTANEGEPEAKRANLRRALRRVHESDEGRGSNERRS